MTREQSNLVRRTMRIVNAGGVVMWNLIQRTVSAVHQKAKALEPWASLAAVVVSVYAIKLANDSGREMGSLLTRLNDSFGRTEDRLSVLPDRIERFDEAVEGLGQVVSTQRKTMEESLDGLSTNITAFTDRLHLYGERLDAIVLSSDRQLRLLDERQALLEAELSRKSRLSVRFDAEPADSGSWRIYPVVANQGDAVSSFYTYFFKIPSSYGVSDIGLNQRLDVDDTTIHLSFTSNDPIGFTGVDSVHVVSIPGRAQFTLRNPPTDGKILLDCTVISEHGAHSELIQVRPKGKFYRSGGKARVPF